MYKYFTMNIQKAERATIRFCKGIEIDGYRLPSGEFRVGKTGAALALGYAKDWVGQIKGKVLKALKDKGYTESDTLVAMDSIQGGGTRAKTISLLDFKRLIIYAAKKGKPHAEALLDAIIDVSLEDWFRLSFGQEQLTLEEKRERFYINYCHALDWHAEDQSDWELIEQQEMFLMN